jgi:hypothetical protein
VIQGDVGDDAGQRRDDVGGIQPAAQAGFPDDEVALLFREKFQRQDGGELEQRDVILGLDGA